MTITTGENPDKLKVIHIDSSIDPLTDDFDGAKEIFFNPEAEATYDLATGIEDEAKEWSDHYPDVWTAAQISGPETERRFVKVDGEWLSLVTDHVRDSEADTFVRLVTDIEGEDVIVADADASSIDPREGYAFPGEGKAERVAHILAKYSDDTDRLEGVFIQVAANLKDTTAYYEQRHRLEPEDEAAQEAA